MNDIDHLIAPLVTDKMAALKMAAYQIEMLTNLSKKMVTPILTSSQVINVINLPMPKLMPEKLPMMVIQKNRRRVPILENPRSAWGKRMKAKIENRYKINHKIIFGEDFANF